MSFEIAIPSYQRCSTLNTHTLRFLLASGVRSERITVFVADEEEATQYRAGLYLGVKMVVGRPGIGAQRNFMESYYPVGSRVLFIDDDLKGIKSPWAAAPFAEIVERCFELSSDKGCSLWGVHPNDDGRSLKDEAVVGLRFVIGACYGLTIQSVPGEYPRQTTEDWTRTMEAFKRDGKVMRFNGIGVTTRQYAEGGLSDYRAKIGTQEAEMVATAAAYPDLCVVRRKPGRPVDMRLRLVTSERIFSPFAAA